MKNVQSGRSLLLMGIALVVALAGGAGGTLLGVCGPFSDVSDATFCPFVLEIFTLGITTGTTPTTYDPAGTVSRLQMAAFLSRTVDGVLKRGGRRAALNQFWTAEANAGLALTTVGVGPQLVVSDGEDLWVANQTGASVSRVHGRDGRVLQTWTGATNAVGVLSAIGRVFVTGFGSPSNLYRIDPSQAAGAVTTVASNLGGGSLGIAYDGSRIWTANNDGSLSIVIPATTIPWTVTTVATGSNLVGALFDGANIWVTDSPALDSGTLLKLDSAGAILQTVTVGTAGNAPKFPVFDGTSIWVPNYNSTSVTVVRASNGAILATLTGNGLNGPNSAAFDGQRILVTNNTAGANSVSLWKAADLTPLGSFGTGPGTAPNGACSDGINFWITLHSSNQLARF
jgi:hypothetical protein